MAEIRGTFWSSRWTCGLEEAATLSTVWAKRCSGTSVGLELYPRAGGLLSERLRFLEGSRRRSFLDLKLHDIPNTVSPRRDAARDAGRRSARPARGPRPGGP